MISLRAAAQPRSQVKWVSNLQRSAPVDLKPVATANVALTRSLVTLSVGFMALLFLLEIGIRNGELNQVFYLLRGIHDADPSLLARDWYTVSSMQYHGWWNVVISLLVRENLLVVGLTVGTIIVSVTFTLGVYAALKALYSEPLLPCAVALALFGGLFTRGLGDWDLLAASIEPFSISGAVLVCGLACLAWRKPLGAGVCLGLSALLHPHFAVLLVAVLLVSAVPLVLTEGPRYFAMLVIPFALLAAPTLWRVYFFASAPGGHEADLILRLVDPQHRTPWRVALKPFLLFFSALSLGTAGVAIRRPRFQSGLFVVLASALVIVLGSLFACSMGISETLQQALPWRLSTILILAGLAAGSAGLSHGFLRESRAHPARFWWMMAYASLALMAVCGTFRMRWTVLVVAGVPFLAGWVNKVRYFNAKVVSVVAPLAVSLIAMGPVAVRELGKSHLDIRPVESVRSPVYTWARSETPADTLWVVPPDWKDFRLNAKRAIVVDWSATPAYAADVVEWQRRMRDITGLTEMRTADQVDAAYREMNCDRVTHLQQTYGIDYVAADVSAQLPCAIQVYADGAFGVWKLGTAPYAKGRAVPQIDPSHASPRIRSVRLTGMPTRVVP